MGVKHYSDGATEPSKKYGDIFRRLDTIHNVTDGQTDGLTPGDSK